MSFSIAIATPIRPSLTSGNSVTANRWAAQLKHLGHRTEVIGVVEGAPQDSLAPAADLVVVLHARRSAYAVRAAKAERPDRPLIVALTGTDLYRDLPDDRTARESLDIADALVVLQKHGLVHLSAMKPQWEAKARLINQSVTSVERSARREPGCFRVVVLAHLRDVKDPLLAASAARLLPLTSTVEVVLAGSAHDAEWAALARLETNTNPRFRWVGDLDSTEAAELLASAHVLACTSLLEGGANVVSEAIAQGVAVVATDVGGNRGLLGDDHPGLVPVGNAQALAELFIKLETNPRELDALTQRSVDRRWMTAPNHERSQWQALIADLSEGRPAPSG